MIREARFSFIEDDGPWHVAVIEYGMTHGVMRLALHHGDYPLHKELVCGDVAHFSGDLMGGPYELSLREEPTADDRCCWSLVATNNRLVVRCRTLSIGPGRS